MWGCDRSGEINSKKSRIFANILRVYMLGYLFETSWEVCNKVGGIYAVLSTKANTLKQLYKDKVIFIGPDEWKSGNESPYFIERKSILRSWQRKSHLPHGISVRVGRWDVPGKPIAILVDYRGLYSVKNEFYGMMWERFRVDSLHAYGDYDESCMFGLAAAMVIESIVNWAQPHDEVIAHFDEWTTGMGLLHVKLNNPNVATVFTTHATSIGRSICGNGKPLYDYMAGYNGDQMASELNMQSKHSLEKAAAHAAHCFTTVSKVTARECTQLLERTPEVTPNAFEQSFVPIGKEMVARRTMARERILRVANALTGQTYGDDTMIVATSGRNEFRNKGIDLYLDSLKDLCAKLDGNCDRKMLALILVPAWVKQPRHDLQHAIASGDCVGGDKTITHELNNEEADCIKTRINELGFCPGCNVDVIYVPSYLNGDDGIFNMGYYDILTGLDLTVFPSYYEPWGYTPLESQAMGTPTITTDLSGYGQWLLDTCGHDVESSGAVVLHRSDSGYEETVCALSHQLALFFNIDANKMCDLRERAQSTARIASWSNFMQYYHKAYAKAIEQKNTKR